MKCFYHIDRDAVGICKFCHKGLCPECAIDSNAGLACIGKECQDQVLMQDEMTRRSQRAMDNTAKAYRASALMYTLLGLAMFIPGLILTLKKESSAILIIVLGILFFFSALMSYINSRRFQ